jgi:diadenosine tetraphosphate (Ap4A) HIT family hydrolase
VKISPKKNVEDRTFLTSKQAIELMRFTIVVGEAMKKAMQSIGVEIGRINYQDNGNWTPHLHVHLYCRAKTATMQKYGDPIIPGHKNIYKPLNRDDVKKVHGELEKLFSQEEYSNKNWGL